MNFQGFLNRASNSFKRRVVSRLPQGVRTKLKKAKDLGPKGVVAKVVSKTSEVGTSATEVRQKRHISELSKQNKYLTEFLSGVAIAPWTDTGIAENLLKMHRHQPSLVMALSSALLRKQDSFQSGLLALIKIQHKRKIFGFVADLVDRYPEEDVLKDCYVEAVMSYAAIGSPKASALIDRFLTEGDWASDVLPPIEAIKASYEAAILIEDADRVAALIAKTPAADTSNILPGSYDLLRLQAENWLDRANTSVDEVCRPGSVRMGAVGYRSPLKPSTNIGDYIQTIALMGVMSAVMPTDVKVHGGGQTVFDRVAARVKRRTEALDQTVDMVWIDRDDPSTTPTGAPIWLPINGWFMHPKTEGNFAFPFADNIRPIFLGMHINRPHMLTDEAVAYLKKYAPIGARDYHTADLLVVNGVDAFFSGCPTLSLDEIFGRPAADDRNGKFRGAHATKKDLNGRTELIHMEPSMPTWSKDKSLETAWTYIETYQNAEHVETPLLHCYLPCRAMNTPVTFVNPKRETDPRFEGLIDITEEGRQELVSRLKDNVDAVFGLIFSGASEEAIYDEWRRRNADGVAKIKARHAQRLKQFPIPESNIMKALEGLTKRTFINGEAKGAPKAGHDGPEVVFCYDKNFDRPTFVTIRSMLANTKSKVRITLLTRELNQDRIEALSREFPETEFAWLDVTNVKFEKLNLLRHTTLSTMDRLFLPQLIDYADRVIYLDIDIAVCGDINDLYTFDLQGNALGCRETIFPGWNSGYSLSQMIEKQITPEQTLRFRQQFMYSEPLSYGTFNAGVQLQDLKKLREQKFTQRLLQIVDDYGVNDQFACNLFAAGNFARLPNSWNYFATQEWIDKPDLIHYTGYIKPWDAEHCPKAEVWRSYIKAGDGIVMAPATDKSWFK